MIINKKKWIYKYTTTPSTVLYERKKTMTVQCSINEKDEMIKHHSHSITGKKSDISYLEQ